MFSNKKGLAMVVVIGIVLALLILGAAVLMISTGHFGTSYYQIRRARAFYAAEAGMQHALWKCRRGDYNLETASSWPITDSVTINDPRYTLTANIEIYPLNHFDPLGLSRPTPQDTFPVVIRVNY